MLTRKFLNIYGIIGVGIMVVLLVLVWFKLVPSSYYLTLFSIALAIWISRLVMRVIVVRRERMEKPVDNQFPTP